MESKILYSLFKSYGLQDVLPLVQKYIDKNKEEIYLNKFSNPQIAENVIKLFDKPICYFVSDETELNSIHSYISVTDKPHELFKNNGICHACYPISRLARIFRNKIFNFAEYDMIKTKLNKWKFRRQKINPIIIKQLYDKIKLYIKTIRENALLYETKEPINQDASDCLLEKWRPKENSLNVFI